MSKKKKKYAIRSPLQVKGGIRAQGAHGEPVRVWWSRRWTDALEQFRMGARLGRGRQYAASGQVSELALAPGCASAVVQGAVPEPYRCEIRFTSVEGDAKGRIIGTLRKNPMLLARLLVGDMPREAEVIFKAEGCPLFPERGDDLKSKCSCPDWANPCKHLAAVYCLLGETITKNPLTLLAIRGVAKDELVVMPNDQETSRVESGRVELSQGELSSACAGLRRNGSTRIENPTAHSALTREAFYGEPREPLTDFGAALKTDCAAPLVRRLGPLPFWRGQERFADTLEHLAHRAAARGWTVWTGEPLDLRAPEEKVIVKGASLRLKQALRLEKF